MSFMERVSTFFGLEDEEYAGNEQREQTQKVAAKTVQQNRTAKKSAPSQKKTFNLTSFQCEGVCS
ncbi:hypothetical protein [Tetragenococcus muriaticus]|uniref:Uncharacterized protein n=1 Tax=Tetragenococcus muriaticus 3MR10-3 TaxID=1302648 RepID=A0A091C542_9ENTE|nr:hypothetical protein [Tetragenococcus muriaticus]KFN92024.1 hypothetical protein TMU3MR103_0746 [Tetragenococcus muriaticus 3MR10-3]